MTLSPSCLHKEAASPPFALRPVRQALHRRSNGRAVDALLLQHSTVLRSLLIPFTTKSNPLEIDVGEILPPGLTFAQRNCAGNREIVGTP